MPVLLGSPSRFSIIDFIQKNSSKRPTFWNVCSGGAQSLLAMPPKFVESRLYADPETATRKLVEIARDITPASDRGALDGLLRLRATDSVQILLDLRGQSRRLADSIKRPGHFNFSKLEFC
jgi:hypothetical protein